MAEIPTSEEAAQYILDIFVKRFHRRPGQILRPANFFRAFFEPPWQSSDFSKGMAFASEHGWVEILPGSVSFKLTESGFFKAGGAGVNWARVCNERITIERQDGSRYSDVPAYVEKGRALIPEEKVPIAPGDVILRELPNGLVERLIITDPNFNAKNHGMPAHYQAKYRREGQQPAGRPGHAIHIAGGQNFRVNISSIDNSSNTISYAFQARDLAFSSARLRALHSHRSDIFGGDRSQIWRSLQSPPGFIYSWSCE